MIYTEHKVSTAQGTLVLTGTASGKVVATIKYSVFPQMAMAFEMADAEKLHSALGLVIEQMKRGAA